jgi:pyridoxine 5-phosphate synthase
LVHQAGLRLHAGHGLNYRNTAPVARIEGMRELNIGHSIICRSLFIGLRAAVAVIKKMLYAGVLLGTLLRAG